MTGWALVRDRARLADTTVSAAAVLLSMFCLIPLFVGLRWVVPAMALIAVVAILGAASRAIAMPLPLVPIVEVFGIIGFLAAVFAAPRAWARILPTPDALNTLRELTQQGVADAQRYAAPVPTWPGVVLLAVGGIGLAALSADSLFVSIRTPLLAGVPLLALYLAPALVLHGGAPWWSFALPAAGWLLILAADQRERVREWSGLASSTRIRGLSGLARGIGAVAIVAATVAAVILPVRAPIIELSGGEGPGGGAAAAGEVVLDPLVSLRRDILLAGDTEVLRYRTQAKHPSYLRVTALESFDGVTWQAREDRAAGPDGAIPLPGDILAGLTAPDPTYHVRGGSSYTYDFTITSLRNAYLPLPYPISHLADEGGLDADWRLDPGTGVASSRERAATGMRYEVTALDPQVKPDELRAAAVPSSDFAPQLSLPSGLSPRVRELALEVTTKSGTAYEQALALQRWFTRDGGFRYSTSVRSGADADYIAEFLKDRVGYCEQFAASMAVMARTLGIPARVVVGFTQGSPVGDGSWRVTARDAHAWPELWFDGVGWMRFEPTPRSDASVVPPDYAPAPVAATPGTGIRPGVLDAEGSELFAAPSRAEGGRSPMALAAVALAAGGIILLAWPMVRRMIRRRRRLHADTYPEVVDGAWAEVADSAIDFGQPWPVSSTPRQAAERISGGMDEPGVQALQRLRSQVEQARYARSMTMQRSVPDERSAAVRADVRTVRRQLQARVRWHAKVMGYCWPPSERRRQRSSMRSMNPGDLEGRGAAGPAAAAASAGRTWKDE